MYKGEPANPAKPGARFGANSWADSEGHFWLYGGSANVGGGRDGSTVFCYY